MIKAVNAIVSVISNIYLVTQKCCFSFQCGTGYVMLQVCQKFRLIRSLMSFKSLMLTKTALI